MERRDFAKARYIIAYYFHVLIMKSLRPLQLVLDPGNKNLEELRGRAVYNYLDLASAARTNGTMSPQGEIENVRSRTYRFLNFYPF